MAPMNLLLEESDSDSASPDEHPPNRIESRAEIHPSPRNEAPTMPTTSTGEVLTLPGATGLPTTTSADSTVDPNPPADSGGAVEVDNEGFGFDEEYFGENRGGATGEHSSNSSDSLQVEIHGRKNTVDGKNSNA